jgi:hypothetical protein
VLPNPRLAAVFEFWVLGLIQKGLWTAEHFQQPAAIDFFPQDFDQKGAALAGSDQGVNVSEEVVREEDVGALSWHLVLQS